MSENLRKLVTVRQINAIEPIEGADAIEIAVVEGWKVVTKKNEFRVGDQCVYFEIDSFLPTGNPAWQFLVDKSSRTFEGVVGHRLRTVKLRGQISQGLVLKLDQVPEIIVEWDRLCNEPGLKAANTTVRDVDFSELLGIVKWEAPLPACLAGQAEGLFPSFIPKTDQERCQNLKAEIFGYDDTSVEFSIEEMSQEAIDTMIDKGLLVWHDETSKWHKVNKAKADRDAEYEISMKLDGSSCTVFARVIGEREVNACPPGGVGGQMAWSERVVESGVCSRNLQLKVNEANAENSFVKTVVSSGLLKTLEGFASERGIELAVQGELMGPGIQGNRENLKDFKIFVFDIIDIKTGEKLSPVKRLEMYNELIWAGTDSKIIDHVPVPYARTTLQELGLNSIEDLLKFAEGPSLNHPIREGLVFKRMDGKFSWKVISNSFLAREKD
jgi:hypothetical protein